ncbi:hypothetical protein, partial [Alicyclobacillus sp.]|uniref:hypothetical protein n=1 Tax=Alicyclobacillus sp. TaxID=61169 RepID=UPI0025BE510A
MLDGVAVNDVLRALAPGLVRLLVNPLLYAGAGLVLWDVWRNARHERAFFGVRVTRRRRLVLALAGLSALGGALVSAWDVALRAAVGPGEVWAVSVFALLLALIRPRWLSPLYAATLLATVAGVAAWAAPGGAGTGWTGGWPAPSELGRVAWAVVDGFHTAGWAALLAGVTLCEALLLALFQTRRLRPVYVLSKRG